jgi:hypothetical protein
MGKQQIKFQWHVIAHSTVMLKLALARLHCDFPLLRCLESFFKRFHMRYRLLQAVEFNFVLKSGCSNSC